ncbi:hypothetical protein [Sphingobium sp. YBL2]|uniref:hypothetical protein n=1 Tax=Sphingobium sp. (strain YBL2) TaxID=484429 RepID=UPI00155DC6A5|nr:hypothetical protein [Sphingobium sp. YBL2]
MHVILADITNVVGHRIMRSPGLAAHRIDFANGGVAKILFTCDGLLQQFESYRIDVVARDRKIILINRCG